MDNENMLFLLLNILNRQKVDKKKKLRDAFTIQ